MENHYDSIIKENNILHDKINTHLFSVNSDKQELDDEKSKYLKDVIIDMRFMNNCLFGIYLVLLVGLAYIIYNKELDIRAKTSLVLLFLIYPFFISGLQDNLRFIYNFLFSATTNINVSSVPDKNELINTNVPNNNTDNDNEVNYNSLSKENSILDTKITNFGNNSVTNVRHSEFTLDKSDSYKSINVYLFYFYYICVLGFLYQLFATDAMPFNIYVKIFVVIALAGYPYYVDIIAEFLIYVFTLLYKLTMSQAYKHPNAKYDTVQ